MVHKIIINSDAVEILVESLPDDDLVVVLNDLVELANVFTSNAKFLSITHMEAEIGFRNNGNYYSLSIGMDVAEKETTVSVCKVIKRTIDEYLDIMNEVKKYNK